MSSLVPSPPPRPEDTSSHPGQSAAQNRPGAILLPVILGRVPRSKRDYSQCSIAQEYGYKDRAQIERHLVRTHSQKE